MAAIDWEEINAKLPFERNDDDHAKRRELFKQFDPNENGYLSLAETEKGVRDVLQCDDLFDCKPAIHRAFHFAKKASTGEDKHGPDFLEFREFRLFLQTLRQYFEYYQAFARIDSGEDNKISKEEFTAESIKPVLEKWVGEIEDLEAEFDKIDTNNGGQVLFTEFVDWALEKNLDLEDDVDSQADPEPEAVAEEAETTEAAPEGEGGEGDGEAAPEAEEAAEGEAEAEPEAEGEEKEAEAEEKEGEAEVEGEEKEAEAEADGEEKEAEAEAEKEEEPAAEGDAEAEAEAEPEAEAEAEGKAEPK